MERERCEEQVREVDVKLQLLQNREQNSANALKWQIRFT